MLGLHLSGKRSASPGTRAKSRSRAMKTLAVFGEERAQSLVEFAIVFPILIILVMGIITFGQAFGTYQTLTNAAAAGAQGLSIARGQTVNPCTTASSPAFGIASTLNRNNIKFTITISPPAGNVGGATYTLATNQANPTCPAADTSSAPATDLQPGWNANVTLTYPCSVIIFATNFAPNCTLTAQTTEVIQ